MGRSFRIADEFLAGREVLLVGKQLKVGSEPQKARLRVDPKGLILCWSVLKSRHGEFIFVDCIVDCRISHEDPAEFTVVCNRDFVSAAFFGFRDVAGDEEFVARFSKFIFDWAYWNKRQHHSVLRHMSRLFAPLLLDDKCKRTNAYEHLSRPYKHVINKFALGSSLKSISSHEEVLDVYLDKVRRPEIEEIFNQLSKGRPTLLADEFAEFINTTQRDPRLNEEIYPPRSIQWARKIISELENDAEELTLRGFTKYLLGDSNTDLDSAMFKLRSSDMNNPITHYYINSSHNTYLNGNQIHAANALLKDKYHTKCETETEMYRQTLLAGCRCIELDCWDGPTGPLITHGPIALQKINVVPFKEVCEAIIETAFKTSDYPIVLSLENHCSPDQQQQMANCFLEVFGDHLQGSPLEDYPLEEGIFLPSPNALKRKILLKGSKTKKHGQPLSLKIKTNFQKMKVEMERFTGKMQSHFDDYFKRQNQTHITEEEINNIPKDFMKDESVVETKAALADLINYFQTTPTLDYEDPEYLMHSGSELKIDQIITKKSTEFIQHTARHIVRVYPEIFRCNSSNFLPIYFWTAGCQMLALNFQTHGIEMQMNQTLFEENGQCGYVLKAPVLRERSHKMSVHNKHLLVAHRLEISIRSVQLLNLLTSKRGQYTSSVRVDLYDLPNDTVIDKFRTLPSISDGYNTFFSTNSFLFDKIIKPEHAMLHIRVLDENDEEIGQRFLPVHKMQSGYRHILLRNKANQSEGPASVFAKIKLEVYVPAYQEELREQYVNPLKLKNEQEEARQMFANVMRTSGKKRRGDTESEAEPTTPTELPTPMDELQTPLVEFRSIAQNSKP